MRVRIVTTLSSIWVFDRDAAEYIRVRRTDLDARPLPSSVAYTDAWEPYDDIDETLFPGLTVIRPVPWGEGQVRRLGTVVSDVEWQS